MSDDSIFAYRTAPADMYTVQLFYSRHSLTDPI